MIVLAGGRKTYYNWEPVVEVISHAYCEHGVHLVDAIIDAQNASS
jgi:hypothetical protein